VAVKSIDIAMSSPTQLRPAGRGANLDHLAPDRKIDDTCAIDEENEGCRRTVEDRDFWSIDFNQHVIDASGGKRCHDMLDSANRGLRLASGGKPRTQPCVGDAIILRRNIDTQIDPAEEDAMTCGGGVQDYMRLLPAMQADTAAVDGIAQGPRSRRDRRFRVISRQTIHHRAPLHIVGIREQSSLVLTWGEESILRW
jgi:hypothetical protein